MKITKPLLFAVLALSALGTTFTHQARAMLNNPFEQWCFEWESWDNITLIHNTACFGGLGGGGSGGSGNEQEPPHGPVHPVYDSNKFGGYFDRLSISEKLNCAIKNYAHPSAPKKGVIQHVNAWAYGIDSPNGFSYEYNAQHVPASHYGPGYVEVGGFPTSSGSWPWTYLFNRAYQSLDNVHIIGVGLGSRDDNDLDGRLTAFENELFSAAHEMAHLTGIDHKHENQANWFGIYAVQSYRQDGGKKCK